MVKRIFTLGERDQMVVSVSDQLRTQLPPRGRPMATR